MQPEDIIQQKEWTALTSAERTAVAPLATTEAEYNLLKKILQVATADKLPLLSEILLTTLKSHLPAKTQKPLWVWYAAAAVLFAVIVVSFLLSAPKKDNQVARSNLPTATPKTDDPKPGSPPLAPVQPSMNDLVNVQPKTNQVKNERKKNDRSLTASTTVVKTSVASNTALLDFVTEVY